MNEIKKMQTPWDSDKIIMVDTGCYERGCVCVANQWDADYPSECVPMVEYKEWVGLTEDDDIDWENGGTIRDLFKAIEAKLKEKNGY